MALRRRAPGCGNTEEMVKAAVTSPLTMIASDAYICSSRLSTNAPPGCARVTGTSDHDFR